jgi:hypothetical protein
VSEGVGVLFRARVTSLQRMINTEFWLICDHNSGFIAVDGPDACAARAL